MRIVIALGGNALLRRGEAPEIETQRRNVRMAVEAVAPIARQHEIVITHGNGPQIGLLALQAASYRGVRPYPLDLLGAESEGMIGYLLDLALANALPNRDIATLLTQVEIDPADPAFAAPTKPIGPVYDNAAAQRLAAEMNWPMIRDGDEWRRVVASPAPRRIREINTIRLLLHAGVIVICAGGGGVPVAVNGAGDIRGVEAVVDKDLSAALLAEAVDADFPAAPDRCRRGVDPLANGGGHAARRNDPRRVAQPDLCRRLNGAESRGGMSVRRKDRAARRYRRHQPGRTNSKRRDRDDCTRRLIGPIWVISRQRTARGGTDMSRPYDLDIRLMGIGSTTRAGVL